MILETYQHEGSPLTATIVIAYCHEDGLTHPNNTGFHEGAAMNREEVMWDEYAIQGLREKLTSKPETDNYFEEEVFNNLFPDFEGKYYTNNPYHANDYNAGQYSNVISWYGTLAQHEAHFQLIATDLHTGYFSGDDTVFDYWPSGFGALVAYAYDLDQLTATNAHIERVRTIWDDRASDFDPHNPENNPAAMQEEVAPRP